MMRKTAQTWQSPFERLLAATSHAVEFEFRGLEPLAWSDFLLNPRRLRGSDFLMRWAQGNWSEQRLLDAVQATGEFFAIPYGPSGVAPDDDVRAFELYFERLELAGLGGMKRPDLLVFRAAHKRGVDEIVAGIGGLAELPFTPESHTAMRALLGRALLAVECENSLWIAARMPDFAAALTPQKRLGGKLGLKKSAVAPTVIVKDEDLAPLTQWQRQHGVAIHIWQVFYDLAFGIPLATAADVLNQGLILPTAQTFQAPGGPTTTKTIYKFYHHYAYRVGTSVTEPSLEARSITDKNGHILPYVTFSGGKLELDGEALDMLRTLDSH